MEPQFISAVEEDGEQRAVSELCRDVKECIFAKLPLQSICLSRLVCKEWNSLLSSHSFLSSLPTQNPWLLLCGKRLEGIGYCMAYCFSTQKWMTISLSFLPNQISDIRNHKWLSSAGLGLLLYAIIGSKGLCVCNPLMRIYADIRINVFGYSVHIVRGGNGEPYLVVTLGHSSRRGFSFQIYNYFQDSWKLKSQFSGETGSQIIHYKMVECNGVLFWMAVGDMNIVGYDIEDGFIKPVTIAPFPTQHLDYFSVVTIAPYGSSILVVVTLLDPSDRVPASTPVYSDRVNLVLHKIGIDPSIPAPGAKGIVIWELFQDDQDKLLWKWKEFARMPPDSVPRYIGKGVCVGDYLCVSSLSDDTNDPKVFTYNLREGFWQCLPQCPSQNLDIYWRMLSFEPKLILNQFFKPM